MPDTVYVRVLRVDEVLDDEDYRVRGHEVIVIDATEGLHSPWGFATDEPDKWRVLVGKEVTLKIELYSK